MWHSVDPRYVIDISKPWHVAFWAEALGVTDAEVIQAVEAVGENADQVARYLAWTPSNGAQAGYNGGTREPFQNTGVS